MKSGSVVLIASILALTACSREARKEKKCIEAKKKIVKLTLEVEEKLGKLAPEKERWSRNFRKMPWIALTSRKNSPSSAAACNRPPLHGRGWILPAR